MADDEAKHLAAKVALALGGIGDGVRTATDVLGWPNRPHRHAALGRAISAIEHGLSRLKDAQAIALLVDNPAPVVKPPEPVSTAPAETA